MAKQIGETLFGITLIIALTQQLWLVFLAFVFLGVGLSVQEWIDGRSKKE